MKKLILIITIFFQITLFNQWVSASVCYGTTANGKLKNGVKLPLSGENFVSYSPELWALGRTYVHESVQKTLLKMYENLYLEMQDKKFVYAETGFKHGGRFKPHKTHQNGLSVDLMVPTMDVKSKLSVPFPTNVSNRFGYDVEFNRQGLYEEYQIDFEALGALIVEAYNASLYYKIGIWRVIFAPDLQPLLYKTSYGDFIKKNITLSKKKSWVRHDEHIHIDFDVSCESLN